MRKRINLAFQAPISRFTLHKELTRTGAWVLTTKASCDNEEFQLKLPMAGGQGSYTTIYLVHPLTPRSDKHITSPYNIHTSSSKVVIRKLKLIRQKFLS